ncbi:MAG: protein kinase [Chloroflexi bacterium]|nr:protein kinase [Chloroflexota bacterium]
MTTERLKKRIEQMLDEAEEAVVAGRWDQVQTLCDSILRLDPSNTDALALVEAASRDTGVLDAGTAPSAPARSPPSSTDTLSADSKDAPTSFANGRYQVSKFLGEGGKKRVYQAHDTLLDREVAFALIKTEGFDDTSKERISREAQAMGRLGTHPNIVTVFDLGTEGDSPFMVTELMAGGDIEGVLEEADENRLSLDKTIEIGKAVCDGLEFAHARGIVHRDLKPGNVWLTEDGIAKIGDFGLAIMTDRSRLTREGMMVGTVSYMPPEQATGGDITPKADLYSLGAMLYEMVTGRPPFLGDDEIAIIGQHINTPPVAPTWHNGDCPRPLEALVMRLLAKDPSERPDSAQDVYNALDAIDLAARGDTVEREGTSLESLAGDVFVGRQVEMDQLKAALEDVLGGRGRLLTLVGEPGIGKTRTCEELATYAGLRGAQVLWGRCYETGGQPPYWPWIQAVRTYVRGADVDELRRQMGSSASVIAEIVTDVKDRLPEVGPPPNMDDPAAARFRLFDAFTSFLRTAAEDRPLVLVLDDLHWSDEPSLSLLEFVAREIGQSRVLIIGTYRDMELNRRHPLTVTLGDLSRERLFERVLLRGLTQQDIARFIEIAAGIQPPAELSATVHRHTEGNPLFVTEVVRELVQSGELAENRASGESTWSVRIPEGVREVIGRRLDRLSERANEMLTTAAVIGRDFTLDALKELAVDTTEGQLLDVLDEALDAKIIEELSDSLGHYQFTHALMQQTLTDELSAARTVRLHARIGEALERIYGDLADAHAPELVPHFSDAEPILGPDKLIHYSILAGEQALDTAAPGAAVPLFETALNAIGDGEVDARRARIMWGLGRAKSNIGLSDAEEAWQYLVSAFDYYERSGDVEHAIAIATYPIVYMNVVTNSVNLAKRALNLVPPDSHDAGWVLWRLGIATWYETRDSDAASSSLDSAMKIGLEEDDKSLQMRGLVARCAVACQSGLPEICIEYAQQADALAKSYPNPAALARAQSFRTISLLDLGDPDAALEYSISALKLAREGHDPVWARLQLTVETNRILLTGDWTRYDQLLEQGELLMSWSVILRELQVGNDVAEQVRRDAAVDLSTELQSQSHIFLPWTSLPFAYAVSNGLEDSSTDVVSEWIYDATEHIPNLSNRFGYGPIMITVGVISIARNDSDMGRQSYDYLINSLGKSQVVGPVCVSRVLGLLACLLGEMSTATDHFQDAMKFCRTAGYKVELAWTCSDYAEMLLDRTSTGSAQAQEGDREKAIELQDEALAITQELGMRPLTERILARREILRA